MREIDLKEWRCRECGQVSFTGPEIKEIVCWRCKGGMDDVSLAKLAIDTDDIEWEVSRRKQMPMFQELVV